MQEILLIENVIAPCGWIKSLFAQRGWKVTRVLHVKQAERALGQSRFHLVMLAEEGALPCASDIKRLRQTTALPLMAVLPVGNADDEAILRQAGADAVVNTTMTRDQLWQYVEEILNPLSEKQHS